MATPQLTSITFTRELHPRILKDYKWWPRYCWIFEWLNFISGACGAIFAALAAGSAIAGPKHPTAYLAVASALCTYANTVFNFGKRAEKYNSAKIDLKKAVVKYQSEPTLSEAWLADAYAEAAERLR